MAEECEDGEENTEKPAIQEPEDGSSESMFKRLKSNAGKVTDAVAGRSEVQAEDSLSYAAHSETDIAPLVSRYRLDTRSLMLDIPYYSDLTVLLARLHSGF